MNKKTVKEFFNMQANTWDDTASKDKQKINKIFEISEVENGKNILDVGCGTGILIPDYIERNVKKCTAIDISDKMIEIAQRKYNHIKNIVFICGDAETYDFSDMFDCILIYNAFPHFVDQVNLFKNLNKYLTKHGRITIAHGMSREALIKHHSGRAKNVSNILPQVDDLAEIMSQYFNVDVKISTDEIYIVSGKKRLN